MAVPHAGLLAQTAIPAMIHLSLEACELLKNEFNILKNDSLVGGVLNSFVLIKEKESMVGVTYARNHRNTNSLNIQPLGVAIDSARTNFAPEEINRFIGRWHKKIRNRERRAQMERFGIGRRIGESWEVKEEQDSAADRRRTGGISSAGGGEDCIAGNQEEIRSSQGGTRSRENARQEDGRRKGRSGRFREPLQMDDGCFADEEDGWTSSADGSDAVSVLLVSGNKKYSVSAEKILFGVDSPPPARGVVDQSFSSSRHMAMELEKMPQSPQDDDPVRVVVDPRRLRHLRQGLTPPTPPGSCPATPYPLTEDNLTLHRTISANGSSNKSSGHPGLHRTISLLSSSKYRPQDMISASLLSPELVMTQEVKLRTARCTSSSGNQNVRGAPPTASKGTSTLVRSLSGRPEDDPIQVPRYPPSPLNEDHWSVARLLLGQLNSPI